MKNLKAAVIGAGYMGKNHARVLSSMDTVDLVAIADIKKEKANQVAKIYKLQSYSSLGEVLKNQKLDFVCITAPTIYHFDLARLSILNRIPTFIEKPLTETVEQAKKIVLLAKKMRVPVMVGHIERFNPVVSEIKQRIKAGELGKIYKIHTQRFSPPNGRVDDVSVIIDLATHDIDIIQYLLEQKPKRIYAETHRIMHKKEDFMSALIRFNNNTIGIIEVSWLHPTKVRNLIVVGERGSYAADYITQELSFYKQNSNLFKNNSQPSPYTMADVVKVAFKAKEPLQIELQAFIAAIQSGSEMPVTAHDGLVAIELAKKIADSGKLNKILK